MKRWIKRTLIAAVSATALLGGLAAWAGYNHLGGRHGSMSSEERAAMHERVLQGIASRLELDAAQKAKLAVLADKLHQQRAAIIGTTSDPKAQLQGLIAGPSFDRTRAGALIESKLSAVQVAAPGVLNALADFYDSLRPDQQAKVRDFLNRGHRG